MAYVMRLQRPVQGMERILNVAARVGPHGDCPNDRNDVEAVQRLLGMLPARTGLASPAATGTFDTTTGFYIYFGQAETQKATPGTIVDGVISPSGPTGNYGGSAWMIVKLNFWARARNPAGWSALLARYPARP